MEMTSLAPEEFFWRGANWFPRMHTGKVDFSSITQIERSSVECN